MPNIILNAKEQKKEKGKLNFNNEDAKKHEELAEGDLKSAKALHEAAMDSKYKDDKKTVKALNRKAVQNAMESTENSFKTVNHADEEKKVICPNDNETRKKLDKSHNLTFHQRKQSEAGIELVSKEEVTELKNIVKSKKGEKSPYNSVRFEPQDITHQQVEQAIKTAEKAYNNLQKLKESQAKEAIVLKNGTKIEINI